MRPVGSHVAGDRHERDHLAESELEEVAEVQRAVRAGGRESGAGELAVELVERRAAPLAAVVEPDRLADRERRRRSDGSSSHGGRALDVLEQRLQRSDRRLGALELLLHVTEVDEDRLVATRDIGRVEDCSDVFDRHVELAEPVGSPAPSTPERSSSGGTRSPSRCRPARAVRRRGSAGAPSRSGTSSWRTRRSSAGHPRPQHGPSCTGRVNPRIADGGSDPHWRVGDAGDTGRDGEQRTRQLVARIARATCARGPS